MNPGLVILIGMGVVFAGLILLIIAIAVMNGLIGAFGKKDEQSNAPVKVEDETLDHDLLIAITATTIAAATNTDAAGLRIVSLKRI